MTRDYLNSPAGKSTPLSTSIEVMFDKIIASDVASSGKINKEKLIQNLLIGDVENLWLTNLFLFKLKPYYCFPRAYIK
jgi:Tol biopolymer transport system component